MPTSTLMIARVETLPRKGGERFLVYPVRPTGTTGWSPWYETLDPWKASIARQAATLQQPVLMGWHDSKVYGYVIDSVTLLEKEVDA